MILYKKMMRVLGLIKENNVYCSFGGMLFFLIIEGQ
jgi:hypothetical protein